MRNDNTRRWRVLGGLAAGVAGALSLASLGSTTASADPITPEPAPVTVTQTVTVAPGATAAPGAPAAQPVGTPATPGTPGLPGQPMIAAPVQPVAPALQPATSGTIAEYLASHGVKMEPQRAADFKALSITLPMPAGWSQVPDPNVPDAFAVLADRTGGDGLYTSNAQLTVCKLVGDFDPNEAITHGFIDAQQLPSWQTTDASLAPVGTFPSSRVEGTFRENDNVVNTSRRHVIATSGSDRYLVSLSVNTAVNQVVASATATDAIINGFQVIDPAAVPTAPLQLPGQPTAPGAAPAPGTLPGQPGAATVPGATAPGVTTPGITTPGAAATAPIGTAPVPQLVPVAQTPAR